MTDFGEIQLLAKNNNLKKFDCGNCFLNDYLKKYALQNQSKNISKTFVVKNDGVVVAYYTLTFGAVEKAQLPTNLNKRLPNYPIPVMILARFAVDKIYQGKGLGKALLKNAILKTVQASEIAGVKAIMVDAKDEKVKKFYKFYGFQESNIDDLNLFLSIEKIIEIL